MGYQWNWGIFLSPSASGDDTYLGWMFAGFKMTIALSLSAWVIALLLGALMGVLRTVPNKTLAGIATAYLAAAMGPRIGLLVFGQRAYVLTPLTADRASVREQLRDSVVGLAGRETALGDAIGLLQ